LPSGHGKHSGKADWFKRADCKLFFLLDGQPKIQDKAKPSQGKGIEQKLPKRN
jgi:hypothetical protein